MSGTRTRYILMHKTNAYYEGGGLPSPELVGRVGSMIVDLMAKNAMLAGEGLRSSAEGVRVTFRGGERTIAPGPFVPGTNELPAGFSILRTPSIDAAIDFAAEQAAILGDGEVDIRPVTEPWDIGMAERPAAIETRRYMILRKATPETEAGLAPTADQRSRLSRLIDGASRSGVHLASETLKPSRRGRRLTNTRNGVVMVDGPFAETKELIGGYVVVLAASIDEAAGWADRYIRAADTHEIDIREPE
ncbi:MAG TPA: YciI family protein [Vicinamibacterales bacterium]|nr:YciI family protein [Vicinamibacterales bacterium]